MALAYPKAAEAANGRAHPRALFTDTWPILFLSVVERAGGARRRLD
jgi:hypothetical protein